MGSKTRSRRPLIALHGLENGAVAIQTSATMWCANTVNTSAVITAASRQDIDHHLLSVIIQNVWCPRSEGSLVVMASRSMNKSCGWAQGVALAKVAFMKGNCSSSHASDRSSRQYASFIIGPRIANNAKWVGQVMALTKIDVLVFKLMIRTSRWSSSFDMISGHICVFS